MENVGDKELSASETQGFAVFRLSSKIVKDNVHVVIPLDKRTMEEVGDESKSVSETRGFTDFTLSSKLVLDNLHCFIPLDQLALPLIDTEQFQRLRELKQLGVTHLVYSGAVHSQSEHSLGVNHLAEKTVKELERYQDPEPGIDEFDVQIVKLAGLLYDAGHGPFSDMFESSFFPKVLQGPSEWFDYIVRDSRACDLGFSFQFERLLQTVRVMDDEICYRTKESVPDLTIHKLFLSRADLHRTVYTHAKVKDSGQISPNEEDIAAVSNIKIDLTRGTNNPPLKRSHEDMSVRMIDYIVDDHQIEIDESMLKKVKEMVLASNEHASRASSKEKRFLYDIVANGRNGIDVDKFDYIVCDSRACDLGCSFQFERLLQTVPVMDDEICYRTKESVPDLTIHKLFLSRADLHRTVYTHAKVKAIELMIVDALVKANNHLQISSLVHLKRIETDPHLDLKEARDLILLMQRQDLYQEQLSDESSAVQPLRLRGGCAICAQQFQELLGLYEEVLEWETYTERRMNYFLHAQGRPGTIYTAAPVRIARDMAKEERFLEDVVVNLQAKMGAIFMNSNHLHTFPFAILGVKQLNCVIYMRNAGMWAGPFLTTANPPTPEMTQIAGLNNINIQQVLRKRRFLADRTRLHFNVMHLSADTCFNTALICKEKNSINT